MNFSELSGPVIHMGAAAILAFLFRLNLIIAVFCSVLPDLVDKPLSIFGIGGGRYIGHTLLFTVLVTLAFSLWKRRYGLTAFTGLTSHLLLDLNAPIPWFYPFLDYDFSTIKSNFRDWINEYIDFSRLGTELLIITLVGLIALIGWKLYHRYIR